MSSFSEQLPSTHCGSVFIKLLPCSIHYILLKCHCFLYVHIEIPNLDVEDILQWLTGSKNMPPLGLPKKIRCQFLHGCLPGCKCRPTTSTCDLVITFPVHLNTEENTKEIMTSAFMDCIGFGLL